MIDVFFQACELFLKLCSSILKTQLRRVKREGATVVYVKHLGGIFFSNMMDMAGEFLRAFPNSPSCSSGMYLPFFHSLFGGNFFIILDS